ncbi:MAG: HipA N-terminal domain-containing protein [Sphaerochaeta sp.]|jgi:serine/threonine-protein kinase HipA|nr:HipA N-terminal domain-containing protein [Sphaerochaeta sp.]
MAERKAKIYVSSQLAGILFENDKGYVFEYDQSYRQDPEAMPISLTMPLSKQNYTSKTMFPFFDGLIPEGWLLEIACSTWKLDRRDRMGLLCVVCRDCIGSVHVEAIA